MALVYFRASLVAQMVRIHLQWGRPGFNPWVGKIPWRREQLPTPVFLPGEFHGKKSLAGYSPWDRKSILQGFPDDSKDKESTCDAGDTGDVGLIPELGISPGEENGSPLQYSCWKIPWTEEPGSLLSKGSQRVGRLNTSTIRHGILQWDTSRRCLSIVCRKIVLSSKRCKYN